MRRKKGFTLTELIVVIAIFGILVAVITPSWANYLRRSKYRTQNQKAKAIFNAAQTIITDLDFSERKYYANISQGLAATNHIYTLNESRDGAAAEWFYYWDGVRGYRCDAGGNKISQDGWTPALKNTVDEWDEKIGNSIKRIVSDDMVYKIWVKDYKVQAVVSANSIIDRYLGAHPSTLFDLDAKKINTNDLKHTNAKAVDLGWFDLDVDHNPANANAS